LKKVVKEKRDLKIELLRYRKSYFTVHAHINETQTAGTTIECI